MTRLASIVFDGRNAAAIIGWLTVEAGMPATERWFLTKGMSAASGGQAWRYCRDGQAWPDKVAACAYSPAVGSWYAVVPGDVFVREGAEVWIEGDIPCGVSPAGLANDQARRRLYLLVNGKRTAPWYEPVTSSGGH